MHYEEPGAFFAGNCKGVKGAFTIEECTVDECTELFKEYLEDDE